MSDYGLKYKIIYDNNNGKGFTSQEIADACETDPETCSADAFLFVSILRHEDGSYSTCHVSVDGQNENKPIPELDIFKVWSLLSNHVSKNAPHEWQRYIADEAFKKICEVINYSSKGIESDGRS